eukprot:TRINITY_DN14674_c0_g1_i1.p1 TRINITY_DN14674_c0_g1~~TRINITY_DN14674_c0_g1_i1.p1  ORF type:complete len:332 (+),score=47.49 TRINITY_DN14674_c0_g1_i1:119-997(+)
MDGNKQQESSLSAGWRVVCRVCSDTSLLLTVVSYSLAQGVYVSWTGMFDLMLEPAGFSSKSSGWLAASNIFFGALAGVIVGFVVDRVKRFKLVVLLLYFASILATGYFTLIVPPMTTVTASYLPHAYIWIFVVCTLAGVFIQASGPLFYEIAVELTYPDIHEGTLGGVLSMCNNGIAGIFFLAGTQRVLSIMNWIMLAALVLGAFAFALVRIEYRRLKLDVASTSETPAKTIPTHTNSPYVFLSESDLADLYSLSAPPPTAGRKSRSASNSEKSKRRNSLLQPFLVDPSQRK